jgi:hypothetical protein
MFKFKIRKLTRILGKTADLSSNSKVSRFTGPILS